MTALALGWEYLTGSAAATDPSDRDRSEWPPHPARVFMALAAAWFETGEDAAEGEALRWLESMSDEQPPRIVGPDRGLEFERTTVTMYVPVNDKTGPSKAPLQSVEALTRDRHPRTLPRRWIGEEACFLVWKDAAGADAHRPGLARLCAKVTRIGHSSSLVRMWVADVDASRLADDGWLPDEADPQTHLRGIGRGLLDHLVMRFNREPRERHARVLAEIETLERERKAAKGKGARDARAAIDDRIVELQSEVAAIDPGPPLRPTVGLWHGYRRSEQASGHAPTCSHFDSELLVLACVDGPALPISSSLQVAVALRGAVMVSFPAQPAPSWVSGHETDGVPQRGDSGHLAIIPLPFVGGAHADGHLLGAALAFPRSVERRERTRLLRALLFERDTPAARDVELRLGRLGMWKLQRCEWDERRLTLLSRTWTAAPAGARVWSSATPVVLDRFPKADFGADREAWYGEVVEIVSVACERIGLPRPVDVEVGTSPWLIGSIRAVVKRRPLREHNGGSGGASERTAAHGTGFPPLPLRGTNAPRPQVHVHLRFQIPVVGPVLIGAGRFLGYGLLKPLPDEPT